MHTCLFYGASGVRIGYVEVATHAVIVASIHRFHRTEMSIKEQGIEAKGIVIQDGVWIGTGVAILNDFVIGRGWVIETATCSRKIL